MVKEIAFTAYPAKDVAALRDFYTDALGFRFTKPFSENGKLMYDEAQIGSGWFCIVTEEWADVVPTSGIAFEVDDLEATTKDLQAKGVQTGEIYDTGVCKIGSLTDPDGNKVTLHEITVPH